MNLSACESNDFPSGVCLFSDSYTCDHVRLVSVISPVLNVKVSFFFWKPFFFPVTVTLRRRRAVGVVPSLGMRHVTWNAKPLLGILRAKQCTVLGGILIATSLIKCSLLFYSGNQLL
ncbi:hypothetical protein CDAR_59771 [Caerostris darwini]|uniref:Uncharacterized protein n=1 Tax=Caerostris darwini TaxID=1538125 RepID=A0AAV4RNF7_9ARAC|nr:hypothetical protein CDAR_59771 [Caerostris darwini]